MIRFSLIVFLAFAATCNYAQEIMLLKTTGKVVIGDTSQITTPGNYNLYVQHGILTEKVKVSLKNTADWSDDAFDKTPGLAEVKQTIKDESHLPSMPSAADLVKTGYDVSSMDAKLLAQIEWLWQYTIQLQEENEALKKRMTALEKKQ
jgi:trimeric autotransporter adhesin